MKVIYHKHDFNKIILVLITLTIGILTPRADLYAFTKLTNGFQTITSTYLMPLSHAVAGASLLFYLTMAYFKQEEYQKKAGGVFGLSICSSVGLEVLTTIQQSFS